MNRQEKLKDLMLRLHQGQDIAQIQEEFNQAFDQVTPYEIQVMERNLMEEGITYEEIMRLCNVHANLMKTKVDASPDLPDLQKEGHPVQVLKSENLAILSCLDRISRLLPVYLDQADPLIKQGLNRQLGLLDQIENHYQRKEYLFFPIMEKKGMTAPPKVMWGVHDQIRQAYQDFKAALDQDSDQAQVLFDGVAHEMREMVVKEEEIFLPMLIPSFHVDDWEAIANQSDTYGYCIVTPQAKWQVDKKLPDLSQAKDTNNGEIALDQGSLTQTQLSFLLNTMPFEITFIDHEGTVKYYNEGLGEDKVFQRSPAAIGRHVLNCHPPKIHDKVSTLISQLADGSKDKEEMWFTKGEQMIHVSYLAVRDQEGKYLGVLEIVQDIQPLVAHFEESPVKRSLS